MSDIKTAEPCSFSFLVKDLSFSDYLAIGSSLGKFAEMRDSYFTEENRALPSTALFSFKTNKNNKQKCRQIFAEIGCIEIVDLSKEMERKNDNKH